MDANRLVTFSDDRRIKQHIIQQIVRRQCTRFFRVRHEFPIFRNFGNDRLHLGDRCVQITDRAQFLQSRSGAMASINRNIGSIADLFPLLATQ